MPKATQNPQRLAFPQVCVTTGASGEVTLLLTQVSGPGTRATLSVNQARALVNQLTEVLAMVKRADEEQKQQSSQGR